MNNKFFDMTKEKRDAIINAGFEVFSKNSYKKSPMQEIANSAGISKSLLFHYFKNKKEFYLFLYDYAVGHMLDILYGKGLLDITDFYDLYKVSVIEKFKLIREYGYMNDFVMKAYFEEEESLQYELQQRKTEIIYDSTNLILSKIDMYKFREDVDVKIVIELSSWTADGFAREKMFGRKSFSQIDIDEIEKEFLGIVDFWKKSYYKEEYL